MVWKLWQVGEGSVEGEKQEKNSFIRFAFWDEEEATELFSFRSTGIQSFLGVSL